MGMFDTADFIRRDGFDDQLKCWDCTLKTYSIRSTVPDVGDTDTYAIKVNKFHPQYRGSLYIIVENGRIKSLVNECPEGYAIFDKWGASLNEY